MMADGNTDTGIESEPESAAVVSDAEYEAYMDQTEPLSRLRGGDFLEVNVSSLTHQIETQFARVYGVDVAADGTFTFVAPERRKKKKGKRRPTTDQPASASNTAADQMAAGVPEHWDGAGGVAVTHPQVQHGEDEPEPEPEPDDGLSSTPAEHYDNAGVDLSQ